MASYNKLTSLTKDFHGYPVLCHADLEFNNIMIIQEELVEKTQCKLHGVNSTLRIYMEGKEPTSYSVNRSDKRVGVICKQ